ncbi:MAG: hypothetical protein Q7S74_02420 [Nanoarchaeota archaeon]|nr:hypothetical protein [Nanoarchaeota archaeon]
MSNLEFLKLTKGKIISLLLTFFAVFFIKRYELFNRCHWRICPDYISTNILSVYPNFYRPAGCGQGIAYICWEPSWNFLVLVADIIFWAVLNVIIFAIISRSKTKK